MIFSDKGEVFCWGNGEYHQLNSVTDEMQIHTSRKLNLPGITKAIDVASAGSMCCLIDGKFLYLLNTVLLECIKNIDIVCFCCIYSNISVPNNYFNLTTK